MLEEMLLSCFFSFLIQEQTVFGPLMRPARPNGIRTRTSTLRMWRPKPISTMERQ